MDKNKKKAIPVFSLVVAIALVIMFGSAMLRKPVETEIVRYGTAENKKEVEAYIIRNETVINAPEDGVLNCYVAENSRVPRYHRVASVYAGDFPEELQVKLKNINDKILQLETGTKEKNFYVSDAASTENTIYTRIDNIISSVYKNNMSNAPSYKDDLNKLVKNLNGIQVDETETLTKLKQEKAEIEGQLSGKVTNVYSPASGVFNSNIDGYEEYFNVNNIKSITPKYIEEADSNKKGVFGDAVKDMPIAKISDNYTWYVTAILDKDWAETFKTGDLVKLRFPNVSEDAYNAIVHFISPEEKGEVAVVISCGEYVENIFGVRKIETEIIKQSFNGFKIPKDAIRILEDGTQGVYVLKDRVARFKNVDIMYNGESYVIAREDNTISKNVLLYDEVIISDKELFDGKIVR